MTGREREREGEWFELWITWWSQIYSIMIKSNNYVTFLWQCVWFFTIVILLLCSYKVEICSNFCCTGHWSLIMWEKKTGRKLKKGSDYAAECLEAIKHNNRKVNKETLRCIIDFLCNFHQYKDFFQLNLANFNNNFKNIDPYLLIAAVNNILLISHSLIINKDHMYDTFWHET